MWACIFIRGTRCMCVCVCAFFLHYFRPFYSTSVCYELMSLNAFKYYSILFSIFIFVDFVFVSILLLFATTFGVVFVGVFVYFSRLAIIFMHSCVQLTSKYAFAFFQKTNSFFLSFNISVNAHHESTNTPSHSLSLYHTYKRSI